MSGTVGPDLKDINKLLKRAYFDMQAIPNKESLVGVNQSVLEQAFGLKSNGKDPLSLRDDAKRIDNLQLDSYFDPSRYIDPSAGNSKSILPDSLKHLFSLADGSSSVTGQTVEATQTTPPQKPGGKAPTTVEGENVTISSKKEFGRRVALVEDVSTLNLYGKAKNWKTVYKTDKEGNTYTEYVHKGNHQRIRVDGDGVDNITFTGKPPQKPNEQTSANPASDTLVSDTSKEPTSAAQTEGEAVTISSKKDWGGKVALVGDVDTLNLYGKAKNWKTVYKQDKEGNLSTVYVNKVNLQRIKVDGDGVDNINFTGKPQKSAEQAPSSPISAESDASAPAPAPDASEEALSVTQKEERYQSATEQLSVNSTLSELERIILDYMDDLKNQESLFFPQQQNPYLPMLWEDAARLNILRATGRDPALDPSGMGALAQMTWPPQNYNPYGIPLQPFFNRFNAQT